jgi:cytochrome P450
MKQLLPQPPTYPGHPLFGSLRESMRDPLGFYSRAAEFGDVVRFRGLPGMYWYLLAHPAGVEHVLKTRQNNYRKPPLLALPLRALTGRGLLVQEGDSWLHRRRLMQPVFQPYRLVPFVSQMVAAAEATAARWTTLAASGELADVAAEMRQVALQVVGMTLFSADVSGESDRVGAAVRVLIAHINRRMYKLFSFPEWVPTRTNRRFHAARGTLDKMVYALIADRRRNQTAPDGDLLSMVLNARDADTGERLHDTQVRDEMVTLLLAGHETTAAALSWSWYLLARHPEVMSVLRGELDHVLGGRAPGVEDLQRLRYTRAVFSEVLRLYPPIWAMLRQAIAEDQICGYRIPRGRIVLVAPWVTQRRSDLWGEDPESFRPERFLDDSASRMLPFAYFPFGGGARQCIGNHFAMLEAQVILATLAQRFDVGLVTQEPAIPDPTLTLRMPHGFRMRIQRRGESSELPRISRQPSAADPPTSDESVIHPDPRA